MVGHAGGEREMGRLGGGGGLGAGLGTEQGGAEGFGHLWVEPMGSGQVGGHSREGGFQDEPQSPFQAAILYLELSDPPVTKPPH